MMERKKIIVTGFGPFAEHKINASWEAVKSLSTLYTDDDYELIIEEIPVTYYDVDRRIKLLWEQHSPWLVIHVGVSSMTNTLQIETVANRTGYTRPDVSNKKNETTCCSLLGDDIIVCSINAQMICDDIKKNSCIKINTSQNAGRYLCEYIFYKSLHMDRMRVLFVHVPPLNKPYSVEELGNGLKLIIEEALKQLQEPNCICNATQ